MKKRVLLISQYFSPEQFRVNDICRAWTQRGYEVTVLTGIPNYPAGKFFQGYGLFKRRRETLFGARVIRLPIVPRGKSAAMLALNYLSFVVSGFFFSRFTRLQADCVFVYEVSPMLQALPGVWFAKRRGIPCYLYVADLWPENFEIVTGIHSRAVIKPLERIIARIYRGCDMIFTSSEGFIPAIASRGVPESKLRYWPQYFEGCYRPLTRAQARASGADMLPEARFRVLFAGNIGQAQGLQALLDAALLLKARGAGDTEFCLVGDGRCKAELVQNAGLLGLNAMFRFLPRVPEESVPYYFAQADASLICLGAGDAFSFTLPGKTQSCLACGKPVLVCADGEARRVIEEARAGLTAAAGDAKGLAEAILALRALPADERRAMGERAAAYAHARFDKARLLDEMDEYLLQ